MDASRSTQQLTAIDIEQRGHDDTKRQTSLRMWQLAFALLLIAAVAASVTVGLLYHFKDVNGEQVKVTDRSLKTTTPKTTTPKTTKAPPSGEYQYAQAAVAADAGECSEIGRDMLERGGSAVDAAIAALLCIGLHNAHSSGIGGGHFLMHYNARTQTTDMIDARDLAPIAAYERMYENKTDASTKGGLSIAVPGEVAGFWMAHQRYGVLDWSELFQPSIKLAEEGFVVSKALASAIAARGTDIMNDTSLSEIFLNSAGDLLQEGDTMTRPKLAKTYKKLAVEGADAFYKGELADDIVADITESGGIITKKDLEQYQAKRKKPLMIELDGLKVYTPPPPGSGAVYSLMMNILDGYDFTPESIATLEGEILATHRIVESFKFAYAGRSFLGDEDYVDVRELVANMTSQSYADSLRATIKDDSTHNVSFYLSFYNEPDSGTSHLSAVDKEGNAASVTSSINLYFGAKVRGNRTGILFNDGMDDFSKPDEPNAFNLPPSPTNFIRPGKRPMSSMTPTIVVDEEGTVQLVVGASGGSRITSGIAQISVDTLWFGQSIKEAIQRRRLHHQLLPDTLYYEPEYEQVVLAGLEAKGHKIEESTSGCVVQGILRDAQGYLNAYSDDRKGGYPAGI